jgi:hypothetical protein
MTQKEQQAIDLMLEDLHTTHHEIRTVAKELDCEQELEELRDKMIDYLHVIKSHN